jgi:putative salt-induced outer membrane protein YdiY
MRKIAVRVCAVPMLLAAFGASSAFAQATSPPPTPPAATQPAPPTPVWTGSAGLGLSLNRGNTSTTNFSMSAEATRDPKTGKVWKFKGLYLRGTNDGELSVDRLLLDGRYEFTFAKRAYAFAQAQFLEDEFKQIDYLFAPSAGLGYKLVETPKTTFNVDGGVGVKFEKNPGFDQRNNVVITSTDKFEYKLSPTASVTQGFNALWQANEFGDALYTFTAGIAAALTTRTQLKVELLDTYATRPPNVEVKKNDIAVLTAVVYKF